MGAERSHDHNTRDSVNVNRAMADPCWLGHDFALRLQSAPTGALSSI